MRGTWAALLAASVCLTWAPGAGAHPLAPSLLRLEPAAEGGVAMTWRTPRKTVPGVTLAPELPARCERRGEATLSAALDGTAVERKARYDCGPEGLFGARVGVRGLEGGGTNALLHVRLVDGSTTDALLHAGRPSVAISGARGWGDTALDYGALGFEHLLVGLDHVLFVLGLLLLLRRPRRLIVAVTAFTLGHSLTLALATLGVLSVPQAPVEILIALSLVLLGAEVLRERDTGEPGWMSRHPALVCALFGLVHGLGFAGVLAETGLPEGAIPLALASFNVGIELGQLGIILAAWALWRGLSWALPEGVGTRAPAPAAWFIGSIGAFWVLERGLGLL